MRLDFLISSNLTFPQTSLAIAAAINEILRMRDLDVL
jgi:hypothetical protein